MVVVNARVVSHFPPPDAPLLYRQRRLRSLRKYFLANRLLNFFWFIWLIVGTVKTFQAAEAECVSQFFLLDPSSHSLY